MVTLNSNYMILLLLCNNLVVPCTFICKLSAGWKYKGSRRTKKENIDFVKRAVQESSLAVLSSWTSREDPSHPVPHCIVYIYKGIPSFPERLTRSAQSFLRAHLFSYITFTTNFFSFLLGCAACAPYTPSLGFQQCVRKFAYNLLIHFTRTHTTQVSCPYN